MAWGGPTLKGLQGLDLESIFDKRTRNKSISFSVWALWSSMSRDVQ